MNILCALPWYPANASVFLAEAFARVGCSVTRVGPRYFDHMGLAWPESDLPRVDMELPREAPCWHLDSIVDMATRAGCPPDLLYVSEENYRTEIVPTSKVPVILWSQDGWPDNYARKALFQPTVAYCNQPRGNRYHPLDTDVEGWKFMPGAAAPWIHADERLERTHDFCLYGTAYGQRTKITGGLIRRGFKALHGARTTEHYVLGLNRSLATYHNSGWHEVKWRFFESAACGCLNISSDTPLLDRLGYRPYEHYFPVNAPPNLDGDPWPSVSDIIDILKELRLKRFFSHSITFRARGKVLTQDTYYHRVLQIAKDLDMKLLGEMAERAIGQMLVREKARWQSEFELSGD